MLQSSLRRLLHRLDDRAVVLDIGGWAKPLPRADWVMDLMPYESRGMLGKESEHEERFDRDTWIQRDICDRDPYPFADDEIDFVVCSHTLEDVRDPLWVCSEMNRIAKAGYIEVPSRLEEQALGVNGPWVGWSHHRWLIDVADGAIEFVFKPHELHARREHHFPRGFAARLPADARVTTLWWEQGFGYRERFLYTPEELDAYMSSLVEEELGRGSPRRSARAVVRQLLR